MKVFSTGSSTIPESVNSNPVGLAPGYTFWFREMEGLLVSTREFAFDVRALRDDRARVEYLQRLSGVDPEKGPDGTRLALLVDGTWFISEQVALQTNAGVGWETVSWSPNTLVYGKVPEVSGLGPEMPSAFDSSLPESGTVSGFGVFVSKVTNRVRLDNFSITAVAPGDAAIPVQFQTSDIASCPAGSSDRAGLPPPTPGPDTEDPSDADVDETPVPSATPTPFPTPEGGEPTVESTSFCPAEERFRGQYVRFTRAALKKLLNLQSATTPLDYRDAAVVAVLSNGRVRVGAISNVLLSDYVASAGTIVLPVSAQKVKPFRLRGAAKRALDGYISAVRSGADAKAPLFLAQSPGTASVRAGQTACLAEFRRAVKSRARRAKVGSQVVFLKKLTR